MRLSVADYLQLVAIHPHLAPAEQWPKIDESGYYRYDLAIEAVPKPRMTQSDRWKKRDCVLRYRDFCDLLRAQCPKLPDDPVEVHIQVAVPMPQSWSKKKKGEMLGQPHRQKPDGDNYLKAVMDALLPDDSGVYRGSFEKHWGLEGRLIVKIK